MDAYYQTQTVPIRAKFWQSGTLTDVDTAKISIWDESKQLAKNSGGTAIDEQTMSKTSTGTYDYNYTTATDAKTGTYEADAFLTKGTHVEVVRYYFEIKEEVT